MKTMIERLEAALGDAHNLVKVALVVGDVRALIAAHKEATAERDTLRAELGAGLGDALQRTSDLAREVFELRQERDAEKAKHKALHEAAGALVKALEEEGAETCDICNCGAIATRYLEWQLDGEALCDRHAEEERNDPNIAEPCEDYDLAIAAPLRALRAALKEQP